MLVTEEQARRVAMRIARRWDRHDLDAFRRNSQRAYHEARVALRAARGTADTLRFIDLLLHAHAHRAHARRERTRARACNAMLEGGDWTAIEGYVRMMQRTFNRQEDHP